MLRLLFASLGLTLLVAARADAATIRVDVQQDRSGGIAKVVFTAAAGEANRVFAVVAPDGAWVLRDDGAPIGVGTGCASLDANSARCPAPPATSPFLEVATGDGDDTVRTADGVSGVRVDAGDGDDVVQGDGGLAGGAGRDTLEGGRKQDSLLGGPGADVLRGGDGDDALNGDGTFGAVDLGGSADLLDGGDGADAVTFGQRATPVGVDLAARTAGGDGERDALVSIEDAVGGAGADTLLGDGLANTLAGGGGNDQMAAGGGDDVLYGRAGIDRLDGGEGDDHLEATDAGDVALGGAGADRLDGLAGTRLDGGDGDDILGFFGSPAALVCGAGFDGVGSNTLADIRLDGCEQVVVGAFGLLSVGVTPIRRPRGMLALPVGCRAQGTSVVTGCRGGVEVALRRPGKRPLRLGRATFRLRAGQRAMARLRLSAREQRVLRALAHPVLELRLAGRGTLEPTYHAPGGVDQRPILAGSWRVRL